MSYGLVSLTELQALFVHEVIASRPRVLSVVVSSHSRLHR